METTINFFGYVFFVTYPIIVAMVIIALIKRARRHKNEKHNNPNR